MICPRCEGQRSVPVIIGEDECAERCPSCGGEGVVVEVIDENNPCGDETMPPEYITEQLREAA